MRKHMIWIALACILISVSGLAHGAAERPRDLIHAYRVWRLTEILDLSDEQMPVFFSRLKQIDEMEAELIEDERRAVQEIADLLNDERIDEGELEKALARHRDFRRKRLEDLGRLSDEAMSALSVRQRAQYVVFDHRFRSELRETIEQAREMERQRRLEERLEERWDGWDDGFGSPGGSESGRGGSGRGRR